MTNSWRHFFSVAKADRKEFQVLVRALPPSVCTHLNFFDAGEYVTLANGAKIAVRLRTDPSARLSPD
jgi:hypothetical protein